MELSPRQRAFFDLARALLRLDRSMETTIDRALRGELDLSLRSLFVLASLDRGETRPGGVARRLNLPPPTVTRAVESLVERGLVRRERDEANRRQVVLTLTERGAEGIGRAREVLSQALADAWPDVPTERAADLAEGLEAMARRAEADRG